MESQHELVVGSLSRSLDGNDSLGGELLQLSSETESAPKIKSSVENISKTESKPELGDSKTDAEIESELDSETESEIETESETESENENDQSLSTTILQEIENGTYTCLVCTSEIDAYSQIWSCSNCFRVYDLDCINDWATRGLSTDKQKKQWRCPFCNIETQAVPKEFRCWCGKVKNPLTNPLMPFSCGSVCGVKYENCVHSCSSVCHPALHPVCGALGPVMKCHCGKALRQLPCLITPYEEGWNCNTPCNTTLCPLSHKCPKGCHGGFCGECIVPVPSKCYCGKNTLDLQCYQRDPQKCQSFEGDALSSKNWIGFSACDELTTLYLDCGIHYEELACQPPKEPPICKLSPSIVKTCYCGKTDIPPGSREKCTDPILECENVCGKLLPCGCTCRLKCHSGDCKCYNIVTRKCQCGTSEYLVPCGFEGSPKCHHKCSVLMNCRKHYHKKECCSYEKLALERERQRKKAMRNGLRRSLIDEDEIMTMEPVHICMKTCNRLKSCGKHECDALCHPGPCGVCLESSTDDLECNCGRTVIPAPVRCGTEMICKYQCVREKACGHKPEVHTCHTDNVDCPKCTTLVSKICSCGNKEVGNVLCSQENVSCGQICLQPKTCGHPCQRVCSKLCTFDDVHASSSVCQSQCRKIRTNCPHMCTQKCHTNKAGKSKKCDALMCNEEVTINCSCGRRTMQTKCGSSLNTLSKIGSELECDESCISAKRDLDLKRAFLGIDASAEEKLIYSEYILNTFSRQLNWCSKVETQIRDFVISSLEEISNRTDILLAKSEAGSGSEENLELQRPIVLTFPSVSAPQRKFIHELSETYKLYCYSQGIEPNRYVYCVAKNSITVPSRTIENILKIREETEYERQRIKDLKDFEIEDTECNALVIEDAFFGITKSQLEKQLIGEAESQGYEMQIEWNKGSTFVVFPKKNLSEPELFDIMKKFRKIIRDELLAFDCKMCLTDPAGENILKTLVKVGKKNEEILPTNQIIPEISQNEEFTPEKPEVAAAEVEITETIIAEPEVIEA